MTNRIGPFLRAAERPRPTYGLPPLVVVCGTCGKEDVSVGAYTKRALPHRVPWMGAHGRRDMCEDSTEYGREVREWLVENDAALSRLASHALVEWSRGQR